MPTKPILPLIADGNCKPTCMYMYMSEHSFDLLQQGQLCPCFTLFLSLTSYFYTFYYTTAKIFAVVLWYDAVGVGVGVGVVGVSVCRQVGFRTITFVPVGRIF